VQTTDFINRGVSGPGSQVNQQLSGKRATESERLSRSGQHPGQHSSELGARPTFRYEIDAALAENCRSRYIFD
jgi:hypothetical protein